MKRIIATCAAGVLTLVSVLPAAAQTTLNTGGLMADKDVLMPSNLFELSETQFNFGTARSMAMAGAFTSLGGDLSSMAINPAGLGMFRTLMAARIAGRPFLVNEYAAVFWNAYRYEEPFSLAAYAKFQGVDMIVRFGSPLHVVNGPRIFPWVMFHDPITRASLVQSALLYGRGDVAEGGRGVRLTFSEQAVSENRIWSDAVNSLQSRLALAAKFGLEQTDPSPALRPPAPADDLHIPLAGGSKVVESLQGFAAAQEADADSFRLPDQIRKLRSAGILSRDNRSDGIHRFEIRDDRI